MQRRTTIILSLFAGTAILPAAAEAACGTTGNAYGDFWIERSGANCDCVVQMLRYSCNANAGGHDYASTPATVATISGDCNTACEDLPGYDAAIAAAEARWDPSS